jgi:hypothetical protein
MATFIQTEVVPPLPRADRGFIPEETLVATSPELGVTTLYRPFWRPVMAGAVFVVSAFVLSWYLMLGFDVGHTEGILALSGGAAVWIWVTSAIAFYCGSMIAGAIAPPAGLLKVPAGSGILKGTVLWGLSIPSALTTYAFLMHSGDLITALSLPHPGIVETYANANGVVTHMGFYWAAFITLAIGLVFSVIGGAAGSACSSSK